LRCSVRISGQTLSSVNFDIQGVTLVRDAREERLSFAYDGETLEVPLPRDLTQGRLVVRYSTKPVRGMYFLSPDEHVRDRPRQVWTQCQDEDARHIFPCHDKPHEKQTMEVRVSAPVGWTVLSNGERTSTAEAEAGGVFAYRLDEPQSSYLFTLVAGEFSLLTEEVDGIPLAYLVPRGREADGKRTFARTPAMIRHFSKLLGVRYPWTRYSQVVVSDFIFGGMENTTATTMYEHVLLDERAALDVSSDDLIAHELAHQWFGDLVTCRDWSHAWLNEGFATFMENVDLEAHKGADEYVHRVKGDLDTYVGEARGRYKRPIVCQDYEEPIDLFDRHLYEKGGLVLHLLRRELGDAVFWRGVRAYLERHARGVVETRDLMRALEEASGRSLERFFEQWIHRAGHPELEVTLEHGDGELVVTVKQKQVTSRDVAGSSGVSDPATPVFELTLELELSVGGVVRREQRRIDEAVHSFVIPVSERPRWVVVDPELRVVGEVTVTAPADMLRAQLTDAPTARGRALAAEALGRRVDEPTIVALERCLASGGEFWGARAAAAEALARVKSDAAHDALAAHVTDPHPKVRRAVALALGSFRTSKAAELLQKLALSDESYLVAAEAARALGATRQPLAFDTLVDVLDRPSWADVVRGGALDGLAALRDERAVPHVVARTRYGVPLRGRRAAISALAKLGEGRRTRETLEDLLSDKDPYLRVDVVRALTELGDPKARGALARQQAGELDGRVRRRIREALRDLGGAGKRETDRLRDELEAMRREVEGVRLRLEKLESKKSASAAEPSKKRAADGARGEAKGAKGAGRASERASKPKGRAAGRRAR
jgi:aminopeptidase N